MPDNTITLILEGDITLSAYAKALNALQGLVEQLATEIAPDEKIEWDVDNLSVGSAVTTIAGIAERSYPVLKVIEGYREVGSAMEDGRTIPYSQAVQAKAQAIGNLIRDPVRAVRFETELGSSIIYGAFPSFARPKPTLSFGVIKGRVESLSSRKSFTFTLYDAIADRAVKCYASAALADQMRQIWGRDVTVAGRVTRSAETGLPLAVREITSIEILPEIARGSFRKARGILAWKQGDEPAEVSMRRLRDAED